MRRLTWSRHWQTITDAELRRAIDGYDLAEQVMCVAHDEARAQGIKWDHPLSFALLNSVWLWRRRKNRALALLEERERQKAARSDSQSV